MNVYLKTERMILREFTYRDVDHLVDLDSDPEVTRYINGGKATPRDFIVDSVMPRIMSYYETYTDLGIWAALTQSTSEFLGWFHFRPNHADKSEIELGYRLKRKFWGQGFATEGSLALVRKGFVELGVDNVVALADPDNGASRRVMEKAGLEYEKNVKEPDGFVVVKYRLDRADYFKTLSNVGS